MTRARKEGAQSKLESCRERDRDTQGKRKRENARDVQRERGRERERKREGYVQEKKTERKRG